MDSKIIQVNIESEMRGAYIDYAMSVIVSRALPDVRDGLKPVHRRVLYGMHEMGVQYDKQYKKSARIVGDVLGKYHPHGDSSVYDAMVRMAQDWSLRYTLVEGQGNYGSIDGDSPASMRYTEAKLAKISSEIMSDINKNTVDFIPNFDDSLVEPTVLPSKIPTLLLNGASGIAVGMATNMPPHNLKESLDAIISYIDDENITIDDLITHIKAPDFPTGGVIYGYQGVKDAYRKGKGKLIIRSIANIETLPNNKEQIIVSELPYMVNKSLMIEKTAMLINEKKIEGISDIRDESDKDGLRIVYDLKKDANSSVVLNNLFNKTALQTSFSVNNVALVKGKPEILNIKDMIAHFVDHRHDVVTRKFIYELEQAEKRMHILEGFLIALDNLDEVISLIKKSENTLIAKNNLISTYNLSELQAKAILDLKLQRLTGLEREKIQLEHKELQEYMRELNDILGSKERRMQIIKDELIEIKEKFSDERRTQIVYDTSDFTIEDIIANEQMVITISNNGYIKRSPLTEYKTQGRGGTGAKGAGTKKDDFTSDIFIASAHDYLLIFTATGKVFWKKVYEIPEGSKASQGRAIQNLIQIDKEDSIRTILKINQLNNSSYVNNHYIIICTKNGIVKKTKLEAFSRPRSNGINAITINEGDRLLEVKLTNGNSEVIIALNSGKAIRFNENEVRAMGRNAVGVKGVTLAGPSDFVVGMVTINNPKANLLVVSEKGFGKKSSIEDYRITKRGGKGIKTLNITERTGTLVSIKEVIDEDDLMIINKSGLTIRLSISDLRIMGRATQGVKLIKLNNGDEIASVEKIRVDFKDDEVLKNENEKSNTENE